MKKIMQIRKSLESSVAKTFADMAFIDAEFTNDTINEELEYSQVIYIKIFSPHAGEMALYLPSDCKRLIVENIYGNDWKNLHPTEIDDCLLELLNVLAGNFLSNYFGEDKKHDISLPEVLFDANGLENAKFHNFIFTADDCPFKVSINI